MAMLLQELFKQSIDYLSHQDVFYGHGVAMAEDEVLLLMMHVLGVDFHTLNTLSEEVMTEQMVMQVEQLLQQRVANKIPMAYLVGFSVFAGLTFKVDQRALIPRSPFVELIDAGFAPWVDLTGALKVMDLCTGSGCIGLAIAHYFPQTSVDLVDLSPAALSLAEENRDAMQMQAQVSCVASDLFTQVAGKYDLIVSNPPYVAEDEYQDLPPEFGHEPKMALVSRFQGMELPVKILLQAPDYMTDDGYLFLEVGYNDEVLANCLPNVRFEWIDFSLGGQGICVFSRRDLLKYRTEFKEFLESHVA